MPKKKIYSRDQLNDTALLMQLSLLVPKNDPVRGKLIGLYKKSKHIFGGGMLSKPKKGFKLDDPVIKGFLSEKLVVLDMLEKTYKGAKGRENLKALTKVLKNRTETVLAGGELGKTPGTLLYRPKSAELDIEKDYEPLVDSRDEPEENILPDREIEEPSLDADAYETALDDMGLTEINKDIANISIHDKEWAKEMNSANPDPKSLKTIGGKLKDDMYSLDEHMAGFEKKYSDDMKKPPKERTMNALKPVMSVDKSPVAGVTRPDTQGLEADKNDSWEKSKAEFVNELENQLIASDLKQLQKDIKAKGSKPLSKTVSDTINICSQKSDDEDEEKKRRKWKDIQFIYAVRVMQLRELEAQAAKYNDPFAMRAARIAKDHLSDPEVLKALSAVENNAAEEAVNEMDLKGENKQIARIQQSLKKENTIDPRQLNFQTEKQQTEEMIADMLAVMMIGKTIKSYKVGMDDMAKNGAGNAMSDAEISALTEEMLTEGNIKSYSNMIKSRDDFKRMMRDIKTPEQLSALKNKALDGSGRQIMDELYKYSRELILDSTKKAKMEQQQLEQAMRPKAPETAPVLKPITDFDD
ncbi:MAG: hypothetical protein IJM75_05320 [Ruminococcus sp.]|nr:hypothetical protein [Ruminococcus sp.]